MMKNKMYAGALLCALAMMASCSNEEEVASNVQPQGFSLKAEMGTAQTRTAVTSDYKVNWSAGDKIYVYGTNNVYSSLTLEGNGGSTTGTFTGTLKGDGDETDLQYALYPVPTVSGTAMTINLPDTYTYGAPSNSPMYAIFEAADKTQLTFRHLCGMIRLQIKGIPSGGVKTLTLTATDQNIAGDAAVTETNGTFSLAAPVADGKSVSITIPDGTPAADATEALVFDIPLPVGTYTNGLALGISDAGGNSIVAEKTIKNVEIVAGEIMVMSQLKVIDLSITGSTSEFVEAKHVATADDLSSAISEGEPYITLMADVTVDEELNINSEEEIDLNGNTLTLKKDIVSSGSGALILKDGEIKQELGSSIVNESNSSIELDNVTYSGSGWSCIFNDKNAEDAKITIRNSTITGGYYAVTTNASINPVGSATIVLENSTFTADETALLINVPSNVTVTNCTFNGGWQAAFLRGGTYTFTDCQFNLNMDEDYGDCPEQNNNTDGTWKDGNQAVSAALLIGSRGKENASGYNYPTSVTLNNASFSVTGTNSNNMSATNAHSVYVWSRVESGNETTLNYDAASFASLSNAGAGSYVGNNGQNLTVNGNPYNIYNLTQTLPAVN